VNKRQALERARSCYDHLAGRLGVVTAKAVVLDVQSVQPAHANGKPLGRPVTLRERAALQLRRVPGTDQFVVWKVVLAR
jgi:hypothetical protein